MTSAKRTRCLHAQARGARAFITSDGMEMVLNDKTMLALDELQAVILHQALCQYQGPYGSDRQSLGLVETQRHRNMMDVAADMAAELGNRLRVYHAQD